ncbi:MAG: NADP(H)-dependent aldo-keto reductase [Gammaproteobacteria bacterium]
MEYRELGTTGLKVSALCLGSMTWGEQNSEADGFAQMDLAVDRGINFIDTAEMYAVPPTDRTYGTTETIIGNWFRARPGMRQKIVLASKVCGQADWLPHVRDGSPRLNRKHIEAAIDGSLKRLQTDYLDLYQMHWPDRNTNFFGKLGYRQVDNDEVQTPIAETLEVLAGLVKAGKVRHVGISNETPWGTMRYLAEADSRGLPRIASIQNPYNLLNRTYEIGLAEISHREKVSLLVYSPLAFGVLSGKYLGGARPEGARISLFKRFSRYTNPQAEIATAKYIALAKEHGINPVQMALQYVTTRPFVTSNIIGATSIAQLGENIDSLSLKLSGEVLKGIEAIHVEQPNPAP